MAWSYTKDYVGHAGNVVITGGSFTATSGTTGGDIDTGISTVFNIQLTPSGTAVATSLPVYNETLPVAGNAITIVCTTGMIGSWKASGI